MTVLYITKDSVLLYSRFFQRGCWIWVCDGSSCSSRNASVELKSLSQFNGARRSSMKALLIFNARLFEVLGLDGCKTYVWIHNSKRLGHAQIIFLDRFTCFTPQPDGTKIKCTNTHHHWILEWVHKMKDLEAAINIVRRKGPPWNHRAPSCPCPVS